MATQHPLDDRQHGQAIRRRQGGRTSIYHDQLYPVAALQRRAMADSFAHEYEPGVYNDTCAWCGEDYDHTAHHDPVGSDSATGAY
jgi:hypothetical protein